MNPIQNNKLQQTSIVLLFNLLLLAQVFFPVQLHTRVVHTASGETVVLCTLQGHANVKVDADGKLLTEADTDNTDSSPAVKFSQLLSTATPLSILPLVSTDDIAGSDLGNLQLALAVESENWRFSIRAPPLTYPPVYS